MYSGHVEGTGPAGNVGDDTERTGRAQTVKGEAHMPSQRVWNFVQLAEKS